jgi:uncharacterized protein (DUF2236 family)
MSLRLVPPLPAGTPGDPGLTGPGSVTWRVCRERVVPLGGLSALLPAPLRAQYGLHWSAAQRALWWLFTHAVREVMVRLAPARLRFWGHHHVAVVRCRPAASPGVALLSTDVSSGER